MTPYRNFEMCATRPCTQGEILMLDYNINMLVNLKLWGPTFLEEAERI